MPGFYCVCPCHTCVLSVVKYCTYVHQTFSIGAFWYSDERVNVWGQKVKVQDHGEFNMLENALFANAISWKLPDWTSPSVGAFWDVLDIFSPNFQHWCIFRQGLTHQFWGQKVTGQGHRMTKGAVRRVLISSYTLFEKFLENQGNKLWCEAQQTPLPAAT